jgi:5-methylcytosine-specific restriction endonuclease McrA
MTNELTTNARFSDAELLNEVKRLTANEREVTVRLIAALAELDARRLYLGEGCSSLFTYCTQVLNFSEHAAYLRIEAARAARKWPVVLGLLAEGALHLTAVSLLAPHLTPDNLEPILAAARHKSKREVEEIVAALRPQRAVPASVRKLPAAQAPAPTLAVNQLPQARAGDTRTTVPDNQLPQPACARRKNDDVVKPLAPERYKVQLTISRETRQMLREAQDLLRHQIPDGDLATIFERALTLLLTELRRTRYGAVNRPRVTSACGTSRHVPASVKRAVWERDQGQCAFVGAVGRCTERGFLEYHHRVPYADGGATSAANIELRCRAHNAYEAELWFGRCEEEDRVRETRASFATSDVKEAIGAGSRRPARFHRGRRRAGDRARC